MADKKTYDPKKQYKWELDDEFKLNGNEFGLLLNTFRAILKKPEAQEVLLANQANNVIEEVLKRSVEDGVSQEVIVETTEQQPDKGKAIVKD